MAKLKNIHLKAGTLAVIAFLSHAGDILVAVDAAERYAGEVIIPAVAFVFTHLPDDSGAMAHRCGMRWGRPPPCRDEQAAVQVVWTAALSFVLFLINQ